MAVWNGSVILGCTRRSGCRGGSRRRRRSPRRGCPRLQTARRPAGARGLSSAQTMRADPMILIAAQNNTARTDCNWSNFWANAASFSQNLTWQRPRPLGPGPSRCCGGIRAWPHRLCSGCAVVCCRVYRAKCLRRKPSIEPLRRRLRRLRLPLWRLLQLLMLWLRPLLLPLPLILAIVVLPCVAIAVSSRGQMW